MITVTGKEIIAKYLMGTAPAYASYIALGCGPKPRPNITTFSEASSSGTTITVPSTDGVWLGALIEMISGTGTLQTETQVIGILSSTQFVIDKVPSVALSGATIYIEPNFNKKVLDFEMFRVPIASRGYINDNGVNKIVLTGELPTEERYEISEIGIFSAGSNTNAGSYDSKTISAFADTEKWEYNNGATLSSPVLITTSLTDSSNIITSTEDVIQTNANNSAFLNATRASRYERCRYLNNILMLRGDTSEITLSGEDFSLGIGAKALQLSGQTVDLSRNSTADLLKLAFSLVSVNGDSSDVPDTVRVLVEFSNNDGSQYARMEVTALDSDINFSTNRYVVTEKRLDELKYTPTFSWKNVSFIKIYVSALNSDVPSGDYFIALDALRVDNVATVNPLYGMTGYSIIQNETSSTLVKLPNTNNYVEFRIILEVS